MAKKKPVATLYRAHSWSNAPAGKASERQPHLFYRAEDIDGQFDVLNDLNAMLTRDHSRMRSAGCKLAAAAMQVVGEYDGLHRLALAVSEWAQAIAAEGDRGA